MIYLDNHATTPIDPRVLGAMVGAYAAGPHNPHSQEHAAGWAAAASVEKATAEIQSALGVEPGTAIIYTSGATEATNFALRGTMRCDQYHRLIISAIEHPATYRTAESLKEIEGCDVAVVPVDGLGRLHLDRLEELLMVGPAVVSIIATHNEIGTEQAVGEISDLVVRYGGLLHLDAAQAAAGSDIAGMLSFADMASISAHKIYGPIGVGALIVKPGARHNLRPLMTGGGQQDGLRGGTVSPPHALALSKAITLIAGNDGEGERAVLRQLVARLEGGLRSIDPGLQLNGPKDGRHAGNTNVTFSHVETQDLVLALQPHLAFSTGSACSSGEIAPSRTLLTIGRTYEEARRSARFGIGRFTTDDEVDQALQLIEGAVRNL